MALKKLLTSPLTTLTFKCLFPWQSHLRMGVTATFVPTANVCLSSSPKQQDSHQHVSTEEELQARTKYLAARFDVSESVMHDYLSSNKHLVMMRGEKFYKLTELLAQHGITEKELIRCPGIYIHKYETLANRLRELEEGGVKQVTISMINLSNPKYQRKYPRLILKAKTLEEFQGHRELLSRYLGFTESEAEKTLKKSSWLSNTLLSTMKEKIELLWSYGIPSEAIRDKVWVLTYRSSTIKSRLEAMKQAGLTFQDFPEKYLIAIEPSEDRFRKFKEYWMHHKSILAESGCIDKSEYICFRLQCSKADLEVMCRKLPVLLSINLPKLKNNLDLLLNEFCIAPALIVETPEVLKRSTLTLRERLVQMRDLGVPEPYRILHFAAQSYKRFISKYQ